MMRLRKVSIIARFELTSAIRRPVYLAMTFGFPLFFAAISGLPVWIQGQSIVAEAERIVPYGIVDESGLLFLEERAQRDSVHDSHVRELFPDLRPEEQVLVYDTVALRIYPRRDAALDALDRRSVSGVVIVAADYLRGGPVTIVHLPGRPPIDVSQAATERHISNMLVQGLLHRKVEADVAARVRSPLSPARHVERVDGRLVPVDATPVGTLARLALPFLLAMLLMMALMTTSGYLVQAIGVEKENKVAEVLLSAVRPQEILAGKLLGLGAVGLLQFAVWATSLLVSASVLMGLLEEVTLTVPWEAVIVAPAVFVAGYLFYGSLMLATGALGNSATESQKLTLAWGLLAVLPMLFLPAMLEQPHGVLATVLTWFPFTTPITLILRLALDPAGVPPWEVVGSFAALVAATWLVIRLGARLFRVGLLTSGSWPGWRQVLRQARIFD